MAVTRTGQNAIQLAVSAGIRDTHPEAPAQSIRYHPGLWREDMAILKYQGTNSADVATFVNEPAYCVGLAFRVSWRHIETSFNVYDFTYMTQMYNSLANKGKYMIIVLWPFKITTVNGFPSDALPTYLNSAPYHGATFVNYGMTANLAYPEDMDRFIALCKAIADWGVDRPFFEGIILNESASIGTGTAANYVTQEIRLMQEVRAYPNASTLFLGGRWNWAGGTTGQPAATLMSQLADASVLYKVGFGTTDCTPDRITTMDRVAKASGTVSGINYGNTDYRGVVPMCPQSEYWPYAKTLTGTGLIDYAKNTYKCNYLFPARYTGDQWEATCNWAAIKAAYVAAGSALVMTTPTSYLT